MGYSAPPSLGSRVVRHDKLRSSELYFGRRTVVATYCLRQEASDQKQGPFCQNIRLMSSVSRAFVAEHNVVH